MLSEVILTAIAVAAGSLSPCGPEYMPAYPGAHVRERLFADVELTSEQCREVEEITREFHEYLRALNAEWAVKPLEERRRKMRELYLEHAETLVGVGTVGQGKTLETNLVAVRQLLTGDSGDDRRRTRPRVVPGRAPRLAAKT